MEDAIKQSGLDHKSKKIIYKGFKDLNEKLDARLTIDSTADGKPASRGKNKWGGRCDELIKFKEEKR